jgi:release factor glutamine methyltransferase
MVTTWRDLCSDAERTLAGAGIGSAAVEARWILEEVSGYDPAELVRGPAERPSDRAVARLAAMVDRRAAGEPLQYVLGHWAFRQLDLFVDPRVLIPRPETEVVAEVALEEAVRLGAKRGKRSSWAGTDTDYFVADLGTGSGALALALVTELPRAQVWATDVSEEALSVARANFAGAGTAAARVRIGTGSWFDALPVWLRGELKLVVSNPPYVANSEIASLPPEIADYEPLDALVSGPTGLEAVERVVAGAPEWLEASGAVVCEIAPHQAVDAVALALEAGYEEAFVRPDLTGRDRVLVARLRVGSTGWRTNSTSTRCCNDSATEPPR